MLTVLELLATFDGGAITTESEFNMLSFMQEEQRAQALVMSVCLFVSLVFILLLSLMQVASVIQQAYEVDGPGINAWDLLEVFYDVSQGARCFLLLPFAAVFCCSCASVLD